MLHSPRVWIAILMLVGVTAGAGHYFMSGQGSKPPGQPIEAEVVVHRDGETETLRFGQMEGAARLEGMFRELHRRPSLAQKETEPARYAITFEYRNGSTRRVTVSPPDDSGKWYYGGGRLSVEGNLQLFFDTLPIGIAVAQMWWSEDQMSRQTGRRRLAEHTDRDIDLLLQCLQSEHEYQLRDAAEWLRLTLSARARIPPSCRTELVRFDLTHGRSAEHPRADEVRRAALSALRKLLRDHHEKLYERSRADIDEYPGIAMDLCGLLVEIGTDKTADELRDMLAVISVRSPYTYYLLEATEHLYGLPPGYEAAGVCGTGLTKAEEEQLRREHWAGLRQARQRLLRWAERHGTEPPEKRLQAVVEEWDKYLKRPDVYPHFEPLLRLGKPVVPYLERARDEADALVLKGRYEYVIAWLTGTFDREFVEALLGGNDAQITLACEIIEVTDSRDYIERLEERQKEIIGEVYTTIERTLERLRSGDEHCNP